MERLRDWRLEWEGRNDMLLREPNRAFWERSREVNVKANLEWEKGGMAAGPERFVYFRVNEHYCYRKREREIKKHMRVRFLRPSTRVLNNRGRRSNFKDGLLKTDVKNFPLFTIMPLPFI